MALESTDLILVNRGGKDYKITAQDIYNYVNQYPWQDHKGGIFHVIITDPADINLDHDSVVAIVDLANGQEVDLIGQAGEFIVLTQPDATEAFRNSSGNWAFGDLTDTSQVTNMSLMLGDCPLFNSSLLYFDISNVTDMEKMFRNAQAFNQDIGNWVLSSNARSLREIFRGAQAFDQDISNWDVSNVTNMTMMFLDASAFNKDISNWDVSSVTGMDSMFMNASAFNQDLSDWCVINVSIAEGWPEPQLFSEGAVAWTLPKPVWGTCPRGENNKP